MAACPPLLHPSCPATPPPHSTKHPDTLALPLDVLVQGVTSPLMGQMFFRASLFSAFGSSKRWLATNADGSPRELQWADFYKVALAMSANDSTGRSA